MSDQSQTNTRRATGRTYPPGYGIVEPVANYRPWDVDPEFAELYGSIKDHTMVDIYRLWTLWFIARQVPAGDILEIGSWRGGSGAVLARAAIAPVRTVPARRVYLADTFAGVVKATERDTYYRGGEHANTSADIVRDLLASVGAPGVEILEGVFPDQTGAAVSGRRFALCHIDVDVYQSAKDCFEWAWPRMEAGGVVVFDDFGFYGCEGVTSFVAEIAGQGLTVVPSLSGQAIVTRAG
ncbi:MAG: methyltransferase [Spirochaetaceae bacterium]|nr:MAG: methyltransferase [Spirochaetaceae bacterium]